MFLEYVSSQVVQALKTYDSKTPERWERISEAVPGRSKKDCMKRLEILSKKNVSPIFILFNPKNSVQVQGAG